MSQASSGRALAALILGVAVSACGGSSGTLTGAAGAPTASVAATTSPTLATIPSLTTTAAAPSCPTAAVAGSALGITLPAPIGIKGSSSTPLPAGATAVVCEYHTATFNVLITLISNISPSYIANFSKNFPVAYTSVAGVGDQARAFSVSLGGGTDNEGVVATKGMTLVGIVATATPASLGQIEALINQLW